VEPLTWSDYADVGWEDLERELTALAEHLERFQPGFNTQTPEAAVEVTRALRASKVGRAERLLQSFMPGVDVLRLQLTVDGSESEGVFLRQRIARGFPTLWPLLDAALNLYAFLDAIPGVLDLTRETVLDYGTFFASEAIVGDEGPFTVYPEFTSLPANDQSAIRDNLTDLHRPVPPPEARKNDGGSDLTAEDTGLLARTLAHIDAALAGLEPKGFNQVEYNRDEDAYFFGIFSRYADGVFAAIVSVSRATGRPSMTADAHLAVVPKTARRTRLTQADLAAALAVPTPFPEAAPPAESPPPMTGDEAAGIIAESGSLQDAWIVGDITLSPSASPRSIQIRNCEIDGALRLGGARVTGDVVLEGVRVTGWIDLRGMQAGGSLRLNRVRQSCPAMDPSSAEDGIQLRDASIGGMIEATGCELSGPLVLADAQVNTVVRLSSLRAGELNARRLRLVRGPIIIARAAASGADPAAADGDSVSFGAITAGPVDLSGASTPSRVSLAGCHVGGALLLANLRVGGGIEIGGEGEEVSFAAKDLDLSGSRIEGGVVMRSAHIGGSVLMAGGSIGGGLRLGAPHGATGYRRQDCTVGKDLSLAHCEVKGPLSLAGVQLQGALRLEMCRLGAVVAEGRLVQDWTLGVAALLPSRIRNRLEIVACDIRGELRLSGALVDERYAGRYAVEITSSTVGQGVFFWDEGQAEPRSAGSIADSLDIVGDELAMGRHRWTFEAFDSQAPHGGWPVAFGDLPPRRSVAPAETLRPASDEISLGELRANLSARHIYTEIRGDLRMALCRIGGDVCLTNLRAEDRQLVLEGVEIQGDLLAEWNGRRYDTPEDEWAKPYVGLLETRAATLALSGCKVHGEARLGGLRLTGRHQGQDRTPSTGALRERAPALALTHSKVEGVVALSDAGVDRRSPNQERSRARLEGDLDVSWSMIDHLVLDGRCLGVTHAGRSKDPNDPLPNRLVAASATIRKLELREPLPGEVDLADARVTVWDFGQVEEDVLLERFTNVLENQRPFKRNVYQEVEGYLHNAGFEDLAKDVHMDLVAHQHRDEIERLRSRDVGGTSWRARLWARITRWGSLLQARFKHRLSRVNRFVTGNFTSEWRPILRCWLPLWLLSSLYFLDPARVDVGAAYESMVRDRPESVCATLNRWGFLESVKFTTRYVLPVVPSVGMEELVAADEPQTHPWCRGNPPVTSRQRAWLDWFRPSTIATGVRVLSWLLLSLATGTIFAKMSRTPRRSS
jgi:hypothetical protein